MTSLDASGKVTLEFGWSDIYARAEQVAASIELYRNDWMSKEDNKDYVFYLYGVPRGGIPAVQAVFSTLQRKAPGCYHLSVNPDNADIFIDDILDSGATEQSYKEKYPGKPFFVLVDKDDGTFLPDTWIQFPWERMQKDETIQDNIRRILQYIGEDPNRPGLLETPDRVVRSYAELFAGYKVDEKGIEKIFKMFEDGAQDVDELIAVTHIPFTSHCEHHMMQFSGVVHAGYIPSEFQPKILGLSKFGRIVDVYAQRVTVQEKMTVQIAKAMEDHLHPRGVAVVCSARHTCMECRGVRKHGAVTHTSKMTGVFKDPAKGARQEFFSLVRGR